jgi:adenosylcobinamide-phosphate synthase
MMGWPAAFTLALAVPLAWSIDAVFAEPRNAWHPVAWFGTAMRAVGRGVLKLPPALAFIGGGAAWLLSCLGVATLAWSIQHALLQLSPWIAVPLLALSLKPTFAWRMLRVEVESVERAIDQGAQAARDRLSRLVSRDVRELDVDAIRETAIETMAENLNDSLVAPLFWYAVFGLPGAALYRAANTLDAMWGYRGRWEWAGKVCARADDVLSWAPARLTAFLLMPGASLHAWRRLRTDARSTPSPNGGWPMGTMALRLGVRLRKPGVYSLNAEAPSPQGLHVARAGRCAGAAAWTAMAAAMLVWFVRGLGA